LGECTSRTSRKFLIFSLVPSIVSVTSPCTQPLASPLQEKVRKVLDIWTKAGTFSSSALARLGNKLLAATSSSTSTSNGKSTTTSMGMSPVAPAMSPGGPSASPGKSPFLFRLHLSLASSRLLSLFPFIQSNPIRHFADESGSEHLHDLVGEPEPNCVAVVQSFQSIRNAIPQKIRSSSLSLSLQTTQSASHRREYRTESFPALCGSKYRFKTTTSILNNAIGFNRFRHFNSSKCPCFATSFCTT